MIVQSLLCGRAGIELSAVVRKYREVQRPISHPVIPAKAGIQNVRSQRRQRWLWMLVARA